MEGAFAGQKCSSTKYNTIFSCSSDFVKISALEHTKLILNSYVLLAFINTICIYCYAQVIQHNVGEVYIFLSMGYISALTHARALILSNNVLQ